MRICIIGKFPPIQGGVGVRTYWIAHDLAARGHEVHVITNAKEVRPPFRMLMRRQDWKRCEATYEISRQGRSSGGSVRVYWTDPVDISQYYIPLASPFVSKLAATAAQVHSEHPFDVIYSHYLEPYGIAGHLAAEIIQVPHVVRMAGSDAGRLWRHAQLEMLYDHVLRSATIVIATGMVAGRAIKHGIDPERIAAGGAFDVRADLFCPNGPTLDVAALRQQVELNDPDLHDAFWGEFRADRPYFGIYGKLGETKGSFVLLAAMKQLKQMGLEIGVVAMAHGWPALESRFRSQASELGISDRILQIPFLPHWRVPEFLRSCLAVCCLEQNFPIVFHTPVIAREVLMCGACLIGSTEMIRKLPDYLRLPDAYGCVAISDVQDVEALSAKLAAIVQDPEPVASVAVRSRVFALAAQAGVDACDRVEELLKRAVRKRVRRRSAVSQVTDAPDPHFPITQAAARVLDSADGIQVANSAQIPPSAPLDLQQARNVSAGVERAIVAGDTSLRSVAMAIRLEIAIAEAEKTADVSPPEDFDPLFRLRTRRWAIADSDLAGMVPVRDPHLRMITFDAREMMDGQAKPDDQADGNQHHRHVVAFAQVNGKRRESLFVSALTIHILKLSDGTRTALEIATKIDAANGPPSDRPGIELIEELFVAGLLWFRDARVDRTEAAPEIPIQTL